MGGTLKINDRDAWVPAGWVFDNTVESLCAELQNDRELAQLFQTTIDTETRYLDLGGVDSKQLQLVLDAAKTVRERTVAAGPQAFHDPSFYPGYLDRLTDLVELIARDPRLDAPRSEL